MTYAQAIEFLYGLRVFGSMFGLENTLALARLCGNPHDSLRFIHVAGTNGKGSTCAMLESIYRRAGLRVGLFTSPHLVHFGERIQIDRKQLSESEIIQLVEEMQPSLATFPRDHHPTFFEVVTVMALRHFAAQKCDLVIWETGLGGRLDATNIVRPLASVITNIQYDHQKWLGNTLTEIAYEKAGIIKQGVPCITGTAEPEAIKVIREAAAKQTSSLTLVSSQQLNEPPLNKVRLPLIGEHQRMNAAVALATVRVLQSSLRVDEPAIVHGLENVSWPGRLQIVRTSDGRTMVLDGAHNIAGARSLVEAMKVNFPGREPGLILGVLGDKDVSEICQVLAPMSKSIDIVPVESERSAAVDELMKACRAANPGAIINAHVNVKAALERTIVEPFVLITGSLYLIGEVLELMSAQQPAMERSLNEWTAPASS